MRIDENGNVGIGTTGPQRPLDVNGSIRTNGVLEFGTVAIQSYVTGAGTGAATDYLAFGVSGAEAIRIKNNGNVGIGTTSPTAKLQVYGTSDIIQLVVQGNSTQTSKVQQWINSAGSNLMSIDNTGNLVVAGTLAVSDTISVNSGIVGTKSVGVFGWSGTANPAAALDSGLSRLSANKIAIGNGTAGDFTGTLIAGNVGIGTTSPSSKLTVWGSDTGANIMANFVNSASTSVMSILNNGNVGIGTTGPEANLHVGSGALTGLTGGTFPALAVAVSDTFSTSDGGMAALISTTVPAVGNSYNQNLGGSLVFGGRYNSANTNTTTWAKLYGAKENATDANFAGYLAFLTRPAAGSFTEAMRITSTGNVGIGTTGPLAGLQITRGYVDSLNTNLRMTGNIPGLSFDGTAGSSRNFAILSQYQGPAQLNFNYSSAFGGNPTNVAMTIDGTNGNVLIPSGNVGIGTRALQLQLCTCKVLVL